LLKLFENLTGVRLFKTAVYKGAHGDT